MCCLFGPTNNCQNIRYIRGPMGPAGPQGARGPIGPMGATGAQGIQGPVGPQGLSGTSDMIFADNGDATVVSGATIPLALNTATPTTTMSVLNNSVNLPTAGTYLVSYGINGSVPTGNLAVSLNLNGTPIDNGTITIANSANALSDGSRTVLVTATAPSTLSLVNNSLDTLTVDNATMTVLKAQ